MALPLTNALLPLTDLSTPSTASDRRREAPAVPRIPVSVRSSVLHICASHCACCFAFCALRVLGDVVEKVVGATPRYCPSSLPEHDQSHAPATSNKPFQQTTKLTPSSVSLLLSASSSPTPSASTLSASASPQPLFCPPRLQTGATPTRNPSRAERRARGPRARVWPFSPPPAPPPSELPLGSVGSAPSGTAGGARAPSGRRGVAGTTLGHRGGRGRTRVGHQ